MTVSERRADFQEVCIECGREFGVWFAENPVWNEIIPGKVGMLCPCCFIARADKGGFKTTGWKMVPMDHPLGEESVEVARAQPSRGAPDAAHTPGPWEITSEACGNHDLGISGADGKLITVTAGIRQNASDHANARLIAQAPTLLAENENLRAGHVVLLEALRMARMHLNTIRASELGDEKRRAAHDEVRIAVDLALLRADG